MKTHDKYSRLELMIYAVCWIVIFSIPVCLEVYDKYSGEISVMHWDHVMHSEKILLMVFGLFLLNNFVLLPQLFFKQHKLLYLLVLVGCFVALWYMQAPPGSRHPMSETLHDTPRPDFPAPPFDMFHIMNLIIELCVILANFGVKLYVQSLRRDMLMLNIQNEKMQSELQSLKYQISPHFLMNTLNNIQSLIETDPSRAYFTIQELSRMMRYLLYENDSHTVALQKEVDFMTHFIDLMKIRYPDNVQVSAIFPVECNGVHVPPLLFISFLENAFKHGVSYAGDSFISVNLSVEHDHLLFKCANSKKAAATAPTHRRGIGIDNVRRRLELIYGTDYELKITDESHLYVVEIDLPLSIRKEGENDD